MSAPDVTDRTIRVLLLVAGTLAASGVVHLGLLLLGDRPVTGPVSWRKPATFGLSFGLTLASVVWVTSYVDVPARVRRALLVVLAADCVVEVAGITVQAWRGVPSHLNTTTPTDAAVAYTLAAGGAVLVVVLGVFAVPAVRGRVEGPPDLVLAVRAGFALLVVGLLSGAAMIARGTVVLRRDGAEAGYAAAGFLKDLHGVTLHAVLVLPALAWLLARRGVPDDRRLRLVRAAVVVYLVVTVAVLAWSVSASSR